MNIRYVVDLTDQEREALKMLIATAKTLGQKRKRAQILLACDRGMTEETVAAALSCGTSTIYRTKRRFVEEGLEAALTEKPRSGGNRKLTGREEATLVALACSTPPLGRARWTLELLAGELVRLIDPASVSRETVRRRLAENELKPWQRKMWCIPKVDAEFVARKRFFGLLTEEALKRGSHTSIPELRAAILAYVDAHNEEGKPFKWTKTADEILEKVRRFGLRAQQVHRECPDF